MINMISDRLKSLTKYVDKNDVAIDVGCDHAMLDVYLVKNNIIDKIIVSDISNSALEQGIENIKKYNLVGKVIPRVGNGLEVLNDSDNVNTVIISGMGSNTILEILNNKYIYNINKLIIQSNKDYYLLRKNVNKMGYNIKHEEVISDNDKIYINIVFTRGIKKYNEDELKYGTKNMINKELYYNCLIEEKERIIGCITDKDLISSLRQEIRLLKEKCK
ncbi:MAG: SAM-dependent methyltransferase [Bacilli bacterium]|nr:SAM-dependent methyltransferase [Bacilli bacterium]